MAATQSHDRVVVRIFFDRIEAELARTALEANGIEATIRSDDTAGLYPGMAMSNGVAVLVRTEDAETAKDVLDGAERPSE